MVEDFYEGYHKEKVKKPKPTKWQKIKKKIAKRLEQPVFAGGKKTKLGGGGLGVKYRNPFLGIPGL